MKIPQILFVMLTYTLMASFVAGDVYGEEENDFPTLDLNLDFPELNTTVANNDCSTVHGCIEYLANGMRLIAHVVAFIAESIFVFIRMVFDLLGYVFAVFAFIMTFVITGIEGAPSFVNLMIQAPLMTGIGMIIYKLLRSGQSAE